MKSSVEPVESFFVDFQDVSVDEFDIINGLASFTFDVVEISEKRYFVEGFDCQGDAEDFEKRVKVAVAKL